MRLCTSIATRCASEQDVPLQRMAILRNSGDGVRITAGSDGARAILIAGQPLKEPIVQYGPFVMNTQREIFKAVEDFRAGRLTDL
jgi:quercetin 2,3-dioxygenase